LKAKMIFVNNARTCRIVSVSEGVDLHMILPYQ